MSPLFMLLVAVVVGSSAVFASDWDDGDRAASSPPIETCFSVSANNGNVHGVVCFKPGLCSSVKIQYDCNVTGTFLDLDTTDSMLPKFVNTLFGSKDAGTSSWGWGWWWAIPCPVNVVGLILISISIFLNVVLAIACFVPLHRGLGRILHRVDDDDDDNDPNRASLMSGEKKRKWTAEKKK